MSLRIIVAVIVLVLILATPALAQLVPGDYTITWVRHSWDNAPSSPAPVIDGDSGTLRLERSDDPAAAGRGLCAAPYVVGSTPTTGSQFWCFSEGGSLDPSNFGQGAWAQLTPTVATFEITQGFHGTTVYEALSGIALLVPPPLPPPPSTVKVFITQPAASATVRGIAWIVLWAEGTSGTANIFTLSADGQQVAVRTTAARGPVSIPWVTTTNGTHTLTGTVRDATGKTGTTSITVLVGN